jgi:hypothetical protein
LFPRIGTIKEAPAKPNSQNVKNDSSDYRANLIWNRGYEMGVRSSAAMNGMGSWGVRWGWHTMEIRKME